MKTGEDGQGDGNGTPNPKTTNGDDKLKTNGDVKGVDYTHSNGVHNPGDGDVRKRKEKDKAPVDDNDPMSCEEMEQFIPEPPDGGWGWVIVFASMCNNLIVDGIGYAFGVFLMELVDAFDAPKSKVSMVGSLLCGVYLFVGPIVSAMTNRFGCRPVVIVGSIVATVAFLAATQAQSIDVLIVTYGVMGGFGLGMMYLPSIVSVGYYFQAKRAFATGLAVAGSGLGTFIFPPLSEFLLKRYAWRGALLIIAGIIFNGCMCGALMRPLLPGKPKAAKDDDKKPKKKTVWHRVQERFKRNRSTSESPRDEIAAGVQEAKLLREKKLQDMDSVSGSVPSVAFRRVDGAGTGDEKILAAAMKKTSISSDAPDSPLTSPTSSQPESPKIVIEYENVDGSKVAEDIIILESPKSLDFRDGKDEGKANNSHHSSGGKSPELAPLLAVPSAYGAGVGASRDKVLPAGCGGSRSNLYHLSSIRSLNVSKKDLAKDLARPLYRKDIFFSGSTMNIPQYQSQQDVKYYIASITTLPGERDMLDGPAASSKCINSCCPCLPRSAKDVLSEMVDVSLFKDTSFMLICLGNFFAFLGFFVPFVFLVDKAVAEGIDKGNATLLISIIGITNTAGRVIIGKLVDMKILDSLVVSYASIMVCGVMTALIPFCNAYSLLAVNAALFGAGMAAFISLSSIIICDRMGVEKLTNAFGLMSMTRGVSGMMGPPLAGTLFDLTNNYDMSFYAAGIFLVVGAICHMLLHFPCLKTKKPLQFTSVTVEELEQQELETLQEEKEKPHVITMEEIDN